MSRFTKPVLSPTPTPKVPATPNPGTELAPTLEEVQTALLLHGDYGKLSPAQRNVLLLELCRAHGLDPLTKPFMYIAVDGRKILYASRSAADGIAKNKGLSEVGHEFVETPNGTILIVKVADPAWLESDGKRGRMKEGFSAIPSNLSGSAWVNAVKKAHTQANRRAILALEAPGFMDESEIGDIPGAKPDEGGFENARPIGKGTTSKARARITEKGR